MRGAIANAIAQGQEEMPDHDTKPFRRCCDYLISVSDCENNITHEDFLRDVLVQWRFLHVFCDESVHTCPCGQTGLLNACVIYNKFTGEEVVVGSNCIGRFYKGVTPFLNVSEALRKGIEVVLDQECCQHYHFKIVDKKSKVITLDQELRDHGYVTSLAQDDEGDYFIQVDKSNDPEVKPKLKLGKQYRVVVHALADKDEDEELTYRFFALYKDAARVRDESAFRPRKKEEDQDEEEYESVSASGEESGDVEEVDSKEIVDFDKEDDEDEESESSEEEEEEVIPNPKKRGRGKY